MREGSGLPPQMLASHPREESPCAWPLGDIGGAERGVKSLPWTWAPKMRIQAISLHGNRSPAVAKQPGSSLAGSGSPRDCAEVGGMPRAEPLWEWLSAVDTSLTVLHEQSHRPRGQQVPLRLHRRHGVCPHSNMPRTKHTQHSPSTCSDTHRT